MLLTNETGRKCLRLWNMCKNDKPVLSLLPFPVFLSLSPVSLL